MSNPATPNLHKAGKPNLHGVGTANSPPAKGEYPEGGRGFLPKLRFSEFRCGGEWIQRKLKDFLTLNYGSSLPTKGRVQGEIPVYGSNGIVGTHNEAFVQEQGIVIGRKGSAGHVHLTLGPFCPIDTTFYLTASDVPEIDFHFLYFLLENAGLQGMADMGGVPGLSRKIALLTQVLLPLARREQQKIADCLNSLDDLIAAEGRKLEALRRHKQGLMQQLFPKPGETVPRLRFPRFQRTQNWSQTSLGKVVTPIVREREKPKVPYTGLGIRSHGRGTFRKENEQPEKNIMDRLYEVSCNDLIVNITFAWEGAIAIVQPEDNGALVSHRFPTYQFDKDFLLPDFFQYPILNKQFIYKLGVISPGGAGRNRILNKLDFLKIDLYLPEIAEQQKIADCLGSLDDLIVATGRKLETLRQHKQGLMQQLFPSVEHH